MRQLHTTPRWALATALCLGAAVALARPAGAQASAVVEGRLNAVNPAAGTLTVGATSLTTDSGTVVLLNGDPVSLSDLAVGETARASYDSTTAVAGEISVSRPQGWLWGRVTAYSAPTPTAEATFTFQRRDGSSEVLVIGPTSLIPLEDGGDVTSLIGVDARVTFDPVTKRIFVLDPYVPEPSEPDSAPYPPPAAEPEPEPSPAPTRYRANGVVAAVDPAGTLTLYARGTRVSGARTRGAGKSGPERLVLAVDGGTELTLDGRPAGLGDLAAGDRVECLYETVGERSRALKIRAALPPLRVAAGILRGVGAASVAIGSAAKPKVLKLTEATSITVDGAPATAALLAAGQRGCALYRERAGEATAVAVVTMSPPAPRAKAGKKNGRR